MHIFRTKVWLIFAVVSVLSLVPARAGLIHNYELNNSLADSLGGPALVSNGGTLNPTFYSFAANQGPSLSNAGISNVYSIAMGVTLDDTSGYRKLIDFKDRTSDTGLYDLNGQLNFYNVTTSNVSPTPITAGLQFDVLLTRDVAGLVSGWINGVHLLSFNDTSGLAIFTGTNNIIQFLRDDLATGFEASSGKLDYIRIYDESISPSAVPEPTSIAIWGIGIVGSALVARRMRRKVASTA